MRGPKEKIELDARVVSMISLDVFAVELKNGHRLTAVADSAAGAFRAGDMARVRLCPGDFSRGRLARRIESHEGQKFG